MRPASVLSRLLIMIAFSLVGLASAQAQLFNKVLDGLSESPSSSDPTRLYGGTEFLLWQVTGVDLPPLVTANPLGTLAADAGVIGVASTEVIYGGETVLDEVRAGFRTHGGFQITDRIAIEGNFFLLAEDDIDQQFDNNNNAILGRPFINLTPATGPIRYDTQLFEFPPDIDGSLRITGKSKLYGLGGGARFLIIAPPVACGCVGPCDGCCTDQCDDMMCAPIAAVHTLSVYLGFRHIALEEDLLFEERLINLTPPNDTFDIVDYFAGESRFNGIEFGLDYQLWYGNIGVSTFARFAAGANQNEVTISGSTTIDNVLQADPGGVFAQTSNIGVTEEAVAAIAAQFGFNLHAQLMPCMIANVGYSGMFWSNVVRAGEQIDLRVNDDLFPPIAGGTPAGTIGAQRTGTISDIFAHGLNAGLTVLF